MHMGAPVPRHHLAWIAAGDWSAGLRTGLEPGVVAILDTWFRAGRPAVVRRRAPGEPPAGLALGVPLPPSHGRQRIGFVLDPAAVRALEPPPPLAQAIPSAPAHWQAPLQALHIEARSIGLDLRVYGSLLWQHLSGESYVTERSDVDLLLRAPSAAALRAGLALLARWEQGTGVRADGEVLLPDGAAVAWRELHGTPARVLVKSPTAAELRPVADVWRALARGHA